MNHLDFEREFMRLAAVALGCHLRAMGGDFQAGAVKGDLAFSCLGIVDYCGEMKLLCKEVRKQAPRDSIS
jgi:hypothetical protein